MSGVGDQKKLEELFVCLGEKGLVGDTGRMCNVCLAFRRNHLIYSRNLHHKLLGERRIKSGSGSDVRYSSGRQGERERERGWWHAVCLSRRLKSRGSFHIFKPDFCLCMAIWCIKTFIQCNYKDDWLTLNIESLVEELLLKKSNENISYYALSYVTNISCCTIIIDSLLLGKFKL